MQMEIVFNVRARDNAGTVVKWGCLGVETVCVCWWGYWHLRRTFPLQ